MTWIAIAASLLMAFGAACIFIFAVKKDYFRNLEDVKYHVFWSDLEELVDQPPVSKEEDRDASGPEHRH